MDLHALLKNKKYSKANRYIEIVVLTELII